MVTESMWGYFQVDTVVRFGRFGHRDHYQGIRVAVVMSRFRWCPSTGTGRERGLHFPRATGRVWYRLGDIRCRRCIRWAHGRNTTIPRRRFLSAAMRMELRFTEADRVLAAVCWFGRQRRRPPDAARLRPVALLPLRAMRLVAAVVVGVEAVVMLRLTRRAVVEATSNWRFADSESLRFWIA